MILKPLETNDHIYISQLMTAYALLSKQGRQRVRIIFEMIFKDEDTWQKPDTQALRVPLGDSVTEA